MQIPNRAHRSSNALRLLVLLPIVASVTVGGQAPRSGGTGPTVWQVFVPGPSDIAADGTPSLQLEVRTDDLKQAATNGGLVELPLPGGLTGGPRCWLSIPRLSERRLPTRARS